MDNSNKTKQNTASKRFPILTKRFVNTLIIQFIYK